MGAHGVQDELSTRAVPAGLEGIGVSLRGA
jgi:hypothetical protein